MSLASADEFKFAEIGSSPRWSDAHPPRAACAPPMAAHRRCGGSNGKPEAMSGFTELPAGQKPMTLPTLATESFDNIVREWRIQFRPASFR